MCWLEKLWDFFNIVLTWKIVGDSEASVIYIYIYRLEFGFSVGSWILRFKCVKFFMGLSLPKKKIKNKNLYGLACFQIFLMLVERNIMGLMFIGFYFFNFRLGFFLKKFLLCIERFWILIRKSALLVLILLGWLASLGYISYWVERAYGPNKGLS